MKRRGNIIYLTAIIFVVAEHPFFNNNVAENLGLKKEDQFVTMTANSQNEYVNVEDFGANGDDAKDDSTSIQEAIHFSHDSKIGTVKLLGNKRYILNKGIVLKEGIELRIWPKYNVTNRREL
ncbi:glycosyl hydrolase family 28-related protein [Neobacillus sp. 19]|uniref:glycosyl hydrolase family 28-related protein n=1 Tax=Neobacillus sp. 19 TaxID=3394458 RepID=UPI003BF62551